MKKIIFVLIFAAIFSFGVKAETLYTDQYAESGADRIEDYLSDPAADLIEELEIDPSDPEWVNSLSAENVFSQIWSFLKEGAKGPFRAGLSVLSLLLVMAAAATFESLKPFEDVLSCVFSLTSGALLVSSLISFISSCGSAIKGTTVLMDGFVPVYAGILTATGKGLTASGMSFLLLTASGTVASLSAFLILPLLNCYLGVGLAGSIMPMGGLGRLNEGIKKAALWTLSLTLTVFLGILSIQTGVNRAADGLGVKTAKFMIGTFVPVAGGALSESLTTLLGSLGLLKTSVGMFGVVAVAATLIPTFAELLLWRITLWGLSIAADVLGVGGRTEILRSADSVLSVLMGILLFTGALFIISLAVVSGG